MNSTPPAIRELARRLIVLEAPRDENAATRVCEAAQACEKLRVPLAKLAGIAGYRSLITRAIAVAKVEAPVLNPVQVRWDGSLEGFEEIAKKDIEAGVTILSHLLRLLGIFIGMPLTLVLVRDAWPDAPLDQTDLRAEVRP